jgi:hypothetical protein
MRAVMLLLALAFAAVAQTAQAQQPDTLFLVSNGGRVQTFVIGLNDPARIAEARAIVDGHEKFRVHVSGTIVKQPAWYNRPWTFHLAPDSIQFCRAAGGVRGRPAWSARLSDRGR